MRRLVRREDGQSLVEVLVALVVGGIVMAGITEVTVTTLQTTAKTQDRVESQEQARLVIGRLLTPLGSQVCLTPLVAPIVVGSTQSVLSFYTDLGTTAGGSNVRADRMTYDASAKTLTEERFPGTTFTGTPRRTVSQNVVAPTGGPFTFFEYTSAANGAAPTPTQQLVPGSSGLTAEDVSDIVRVRVDLVATTRRTGRTDARSSTVGGDAYVQTADAFQPDRGPRCDA